MICIIYLRVQGENTIISLFKIIVSTQISLGWKKKYFWKECDDATADQSTEMISYIIHLVFNPAASTGLNNSRWNYFDL